MENENLDLDAKPAGNKDLWLFLIIVDIIFMCVFGFFLYKHFSVSLFNGAQVRTEQPANMAVPGEETLPVVDVDEITPIETTSVAAAPAEAKPEKVQPALPKETTAPAPETPAVKPAEVPLTALIPAEPAKAEEPKTVSEEKPAAEAKKSVIVAVNPKSSKYRRVTFRWFGEGKKVSIVSGFTMSKPQPLKKKNGYWETTLSIAPGSYKFLYIVDGMNVTDPYSEDKDGRSVLIVE